MTYTPPFPDAGTDIIDSHDVIWHIEDLQNDLELAESDEEREEIEEQLAPLLALADEGETEIPDWEHGEMLIHEDYFTEYAQQLAEDIGAIDRESSWPNNFIDWEAAAECLLQDYTSVDYAGHTYWAR